MRVNREGLLRNLQVASAGLSKTDVVEQSSCFILQEGRVITYNDEVFCSAPSSLDDTIKGAVKAITLVSLLQSLPEEEIDITQEEGQLVVTGKRKTAWILMDKEVLLPIDSVDSPKNWSRLHEDFSDAIGIVQECAGTEANRFVMTCIHIHPKWVEACDDFQMVRYHLKTGVSTSILARKDSIRNIVAVGMTEICETDSWIHFRNPSGLIIACRKFIEEFPDLKPMIDVSGEKITLPKGLNDAAARASVFSKENPNDNIVEVNIRPKWMTVKGQGVYGRYQETKKTKYHGPKISFLIPPLILANIANKYNSCEVTPEFLKVNGGRWCYVTTLGVESGNGKTEEGEE